MNYHKDVFYKENKSMSNTTITILPSEFTYRDGEKPRIDLTDALERHFYDFSSEHLQIIIEKGKKDKNSDTKRMSLYMKKIAEKILSQREFMKRNKEFREAFLP